MSQLLAHAASLTHKPLQYCSWSQETVFPPNGYISSGSQSRPRTILPAHYGYPRAGTGWKVSLAFTTGSSCSVLLKDATPSFISPGVGISGVKQLVLALACIDLGNNPCMKQLCSILQNDQSTAKYVPCFFHSALLFSQHLFLTGHASPSQQGRAPIAMGLHATKHKATGKSLF